MVDLILGYLSYVDKPKVADLEVFLRALFK